jgi:excisionase family DNA binding protein
MGVMMAERETYLKVPDAAERLGIDRETVRRWIRAGRLRAVLMGGDRGGYRIPASEVERLLTGQPPAD